MRGRFDVRVIATGTHGPFNPTAAEVAAEAAKLGRDLTPGELAGMVRSYDYAELAAVDGSGSRKVTYAEGLVWEPELFSAVYTVELDCRDNGKLRLIRDVTPPAAVKAEAKAA